ncbi:MAG: hypothetical protein ACO3JL_07450 [Myxococcota bacterium]
MSAPAVVHEPPSLLRSLFLAAATVALLALSLGALYDEGDPPGRARSTTASR